jgi:hypothetical protein
MDTRNTITGLEWSRRANSIAYDIARRVDFDPDLVMDTYLRSRWQLNGQTWLPHGEDAYVTFAGPDPGALEDEPFKVKVDIEFGKFRVVVLDPCIETTLPTKDRNEEIILGPRWKAYKNQLPNLEYMRADTSHHYARITSLNLKGYVYRLKHRKDILVYHMSPRTQRKRKQPSETSSESLVETAPPKRLRHSISEADDSEDGGFDQLEQCNLGIEALCLTEDDSEDGGFDQTERLDDLDIEALFRLTRSQQCEEEMD